MQKNGKKNPSLALISEKEGEIQNEKVKQRLRLQGAHDGIEHYDDDVNDHRTAVFLLVAHNLIIRSLHVWQS